MSDDDIYQIIVNEYGESEKLGETDSDEEDEDGDVFHEEGGGGGENNNKGEKDVVSGEVQPVLEAWNKNTQGTAVCDGSFNMSLEQLHSLLLTNSNFYFNFQKDRGSTELDVGNWVEEAGVKMREVGVEEDHDSERR